MRRHCLVQVFSLVTLLTVSFAPNASAQLRVRKNYINLTQQERQDFVDAVLAVKADTTDTGRQCLAPVASIGTLCTNNAACNLPGEAPGVCGDCEWNNRYDKYVCWHAECGCQGGVGGQQHGRPQFLAWHREFLRRFELDLRTIGGKPNVTIPYWDWTEPFPRHLDDAAGDNNFMGGEGVNCGPVTSGPFRQGQWTNQSDDLDGDRDLDRCQASTVTAITRNELLQLLQITFYDAAPWDSSDDSENGLRNGLEYLHNKAHSWVGGEMADDKLSADDPVFWLHHSFVDCMWAAWQDQHPNTPHYEPQDGDAPLKPEDEDDAQMFPWDASTTPKSVLDFRALGYTYQQNDPHGIPAVSEWGVVIIALLLLVSGRIYFNSSSKSRVASRLSQQ